MRKKRSEPEDSNKSESGDDLGCLSIGGLDVRKLNVLNSRRAEIIS